MKIILCVFLIIAFLYLGISISGNMKKKKAFWNEIVKMCEILSSSICFGHKKVAEIINENIASMPTSKKFLLSIADNVDVSQNYHKCDIELKEEESNLLQEFFDNLGLLDSSGEVERINLYKKRFEIIEKTYLERYNKFSPILIKLCLIFGIMAVIVLI